jgi:hypothetical protein
MNLLPRLKTYRAHKRLNSSIRTKENNGERES